MTKLTRTQLHNLAVEQGCFLADLSEIAISCTEYQALVLMAAPELLVERLRDVAPSFNTTPEAMAKGILDNWRQKARESARFILRNSKDARTFATLAKASGAPMRPVLEIMWGVTWKGWALDGGDPPQAVAPKAKKGGRS
jgi:hypothetical protein